MSNLNELITLTEALNNAVVEFVMNPTTANGKLVEAIEAQIAEITK